MKLKLTAMLAGFFVCGALSLHAQAPSGAPAGSTGVCNDGSYSNAASKSGACRGHKGVKSWYAPSGAAPAAAAPSTPPVARSTTPPAPPARAAAPAPAPVAAPSRSVPSTPAAGGGNGQVWVNTSDKVYHCQGDRYYGKTKAGAYMSESEAVSKGAKAAYGKTCSK